MIPGAQYRCCPLLLPAAPSGHDGSNVEEKLYIFQDVTISGTLTFMIAVISIIIIIFTLKSDSVNLGVGLQQLPVSLMLSDITRLIN